MNRRKFMTLSTTFVLVPAATLAMTRKVWSALDVADALRAGEISLIDIRTRSEWSESGLALGAWPISMHEVGFEQRLIAARNLSGDRPVALICATGGRSARLLKALVQAGYTNFIDVSEGMFGSQHGPGWIARGLPMTDLETALVQLPNELS